MTKKGDKHLFSCSNCRKALCEILLINPEVDLELNYRASCPYCGDKSFPFKVKGQIMFGGLGIEDVNSETCDDKRVLTVVEDFKECGSDTIEFVVKKAIKE